MGSDVRLSHPSRVRVYDYNSSMLYELYDYSASKCNRTQHPHDSVYDRTTLCCIICTIVQHALTRNRAKKKTPRRHHNVYLRLFSRWFLAIILFYKRLSSSRRRRSNAHQVSKVTTLLTVRLFIEQRTYDLQSVRTSDSILALTDNRTAPSRGWVHANAPTPHSFHFFFLSIKQFSVAEKQGLELDSKAIVRFGARFLSVSTRSISFHNA
jgi:hypothetical protein